MGVLEEGAATTLRVAFSKKSQKISKTHQVGFPLLDVLAVVGLVHVGRHPKHVCPRRLPGQDKRYPSPWLPCARLSPTLELEKKKEMYCSSRTVCADRPCFSSGRESCCCWWIPAAAPCLSWRLPLNCLPFILPEIVFILSKIFCLLLSKLT